MNLPIKIELPASFYNSEERDGYLVSEKTKKIWAIELDLVNELLRVCKKHGLSFQLSYGTLIGAVRHKGFIPWDDDFDVWMTRSDIDKLISLSDEFKHPYFLQTPLNDRRYLTCLTRLRNSDTTAVITGNETPDYNNGIYVDIYALDGVSPSRLKSAIQYILRRIVVKLWAIRGLKGSNCTTLREILFFSLKPLSLVLTYEQWYHLYVHILSMWTASTNRLSHMVSCTWKGKKNWVLERDLHETINVPFECLSLPIPKNYDEILRRDYGDYMKFPPVIERGKWHEGKIHFEPEMPYKEYFQRLREQIG